MPFVFAVTLSRSKLASVMSRVAGPFAEYAGAYAAHIAGDEPAFRVRATKLLDSRRLDGCPSCIVLVERDIGMSYAMYPPTDETKSSSYLFNACDIELAKVPGTLDHLSPCMLLDVSSERARALRRSYYQHAQECRDRGVGQIYDDWLYR